MSRTTEHPYTDSTARPGSSGSTTDRLRKMGHRLDSRLNRFLRPGTRDWAAACHLAPLIALAIPIPGIGALIALAIWHTKRNVEPGVTAHGREALNFQINLAFWSALGMALFIIPWFLVQAVGAAVALIGGLATLRGEEFTYPYILRPVE